MTISSKRLLNESDERHGRSELTGGIILFVLRRIHLSVSSPSSVMRSHLCLTVIALLQSIIKIKIKVRERTFQHIYCGNGVSQTQFLTLHLRQK